MNELEQATREIETTIGILRRGFCEDWAMHLEQLLTAVKNGSVFERKQALFKIGEVCHPKAMGDAGITELDFQTWAKQIQALHDCCARAFNVLENSGKV